MKQFLVGATSEYRLETGKPTPFPTVTGFYLVPADSAEEAAEQVMDHVSDRDATLVTARATEFVITRGLERL